MPLRHEYALAHSEFNDFLFAVVGNEKSGLPLTVLSALARLGLDPWGEAARLSELPNEIATRAVASTIAGLPEGDWKASDSRSIAVRLVGCLPGRGAPSAKPSPGRDIGNRKPNSESRKWLVWAALAAVLLVVMIRLQAD